MSLETSWAKRAAVHAALADPTRLRMVDHLGGGDAAPSELQAVLRIASNLLAHHVGVLERAGLIDRRRSDADGRRSYLHLVPGVLDGLLPHRLAAVPRVVFVCTANSARSQLAAGIWAGASEVPVASAGTHPASKVAPGAVAAARRHGLLLAASGPTQLGEVLRPDDLVVTVCDKAHEELDRDLSDARTVRPLHWSIADPVPAGTRAAFDAAYDDLHRRVTRLAPQVTTAS